jgi:hypothetical protein
MCKRDGGAEGEENFKIAKTHLSHFSTKKCSKFSDKVFFNEYEYNHRKTSFLIYIIFRHS